MPPSRPGPLPHHLAADQVERLPRLEPEQRPQPFVLAPHLLGASELEPSLGELFLQLLGGDVERAQAPEPAVDGPERPEREVLDMPPDARLAANR